MTQTTNQPAAKLRYGGVEAAIWGNSKKDGDGIRYSVTYVRNYKTDDGWKETTSFGEIENLKLGILIPQVAQKIAELKASDRQASQDDDSDQ
ncbi:hypothetical protein [Novipirellula sp.]|uniref:hypothetical protein n=1 Tax=Novipirellula sp. TaxID=2795430 RepID=UPI0035695076